MRNSIAFPKFELIQTTVSQILTYSASNLLISFIAYIQTISLEYPKVFQDLFLIKKISVTQESKIITCILNLIEFTHRFSRRKRIINHFEEFYFALIFSQKSF